MRCPDCNKFVSFDEPEVEVESEEVERVNDSAVSVTAEVHVTLKCADCGTELKETTIQFENDYELPEPADPDQARLSLEVSVEAEPTDWFNDKDRHGKPIRNPRYQTHYYGADLTITVTDEAGAQHEFEAQVGAAASAFDEMA
jgi:hypothetical protein